MELFRGNVYEKLPNYKQACKVLDKHLTERARYLGNLEAYVEGTQYDGLPDWFSDKKPLFERAPCVVYPIVKMAIDSNGDLLLGEGRFPVVKVEGMEGEQADQFEQLVTRIIQNSSFRAGAREVFAEAQAVGSSCAVFGVRGGRLRIETVSATWSTPTFDRDDAVTSVIVQYPYLDIEKQPDGTKKVVCKIYRRVIDAASDTTFFPVLAPEDGTDPKGFTPDPEKSVSHALGFCPVLWYAHAKGCAAFNDFDGKAIHRQLLDEIRALDFALSQRHRAALYAGDPQWTEIGVPTLGFNPTGDGSAVRVEMPGSTYGRPGEAGTSSYISGTPGQKARKKSPGDVWQYPTADASKVKVTLHTLPGDALTAIDNHAKDLKAKIAEALGVVVMDLASMPAESRLSGTALETFRAPQLARVDYYREDFGDHWFSPALGMLMRIGIEASVPIEGLELVSSLAAKSTWSWTAPPLRLTWGDYFKPSGEEEELIVRGAGEGITAGFLTPAKAAERVANIYGIKDMDKYLVELQKHVEEQDAKALEKTKADAQAKAAAKPAPAPTKK